MSVLSYELLTVFTPKQRRKESEENGTAQRSGRGVNADTNISFKKDTS
jgi:hypothetical protein